MADKKRLLTEVSRIEMDTISRITNTVRKVGLKRDVKLTGDLERLNKEYFNKVQALLSSQIDSDG